MNPEHEQEGNSKVEKEMDKYHKLVGYCLTNFKEKLTIMKVAFENNTLKVILEINKNHNKELIMLKNVSVFNNEELMDQLISKFKNILKQYNIQ